MGLTDVATLGAGTLGCLFAGVLEFRLRSNPTLFRRLAGRAGGGRLRRWLPYSIFEAVTGALLAVPLLYVLPDSRSAQWAGVGFALVWSPMTARSRFVGYRRGERGVTVGLNAVYGTLRDHFTKRLNKSYDEICRRWRRPLERVAEQGRAPKPEQLARWIEEYVVHERKKGDKAGVWELLARMHMAAGDTSEPAPERYSTVLTLALELPVRGVTQKAEEYTYPESGSPAEQRLARLSLLVSAVVGFFEVLAFVLALLTTVGVISYLLPTPSDEGDGRPRLDTGSPMATAVGNGRFDVRLTARNTGPPALELRECEGLWRATTAASDDRRVRGLGAFGAPASVRARPPTTFTDTVDLSLVLTREPRNDVTFELRVACPVDTGDRVESVPRRFVIEADSHRVIRVGD